MRPAFRCSRPPLVRPRRPGSYCQRSRVNAAFRDAASGALQGILDVSDEPLVSIDYRGNPFSSIVDSLSTSVMSGRMVKVLSWYDNEWGYSNRVVDLVRYVGERLPATADV